MTGRVPTLLPDPALFLYTVQLLYSVQPWPGSMLEAPDITGFGMEKEREERGGREGPLTYVLYTYS